MKKLVLFLLLIVTTSNLFGQELPAITPPSPTAQNFMRYGEIPVDYSTGVPNISIPIYTIEGRKLSFPISISYHASGIKVEDVASEVGLGWILNAGGLVTRTIMGKVDRIALANKPFDNAQHLLDSVLAASLEPLSTNNHCLVTARNLENWFVGSGFEQADPMSDRFFYKLPNGTSGVFRYDYTYQNLITLPYKPIEIDINNTGNNIKIIDDTGTIYTFNHKPPNSIFGGSSEWYLTEVKSADGTDTITFHYAALDQFYSTSSTTYTAISRSLSTPNINCSTYDISSNPNNSNRYSPVLDSIVSSKSVIKFSYQNDREDFTTLKRLSGIVISPVNSPTEIIKRITFNNDEYFGTTSANKRLKLESVEIRGKQATSDPKTHSFTYENSVLPDYRKHGGLHNEDFWGYYNNSNSGYNVPSIFITENYHNQSFGSNRKASTNSYYAKACMLKEISYPTGGKTVFDFERHFTTSHLYPNSGGGSGYVGGFRVKSITNYHKDNEIANVKTYKYKSAVYQQVRKEYFSYQQLYIGGAIPQNCTPINTKELVFSSPLIPLEVAPGMPIMYKKITEYNGTLANHAGKTVYYYNNPYSPFDMSLIPPGYEESEQPRARHPYHYDKGNYTPEMKSKKVYELNNGVYYPVSENTYEYSELFTTTYHTGIKLTRPITSLEGLSRFCIPITSEGFPDWAFANVIMATRENFLNSFITIDTEGIQETSLLTKSENYTFHPSDSTKYVLTATDYVYNEENLALDEQITINSKGETLKTTYKYPHDLKVSNPINVYQKMVNANRLNPVIEQISYNGSQPISKVQNSYLNWSGNIIEPQYSQIQKGASTLEDRIDFLSYNNKGSVTSIKKTNGPPISYLWGYDEQYPVAKVENATLTAVEATLTTTELNNIKNGSYDWFNMRTVLNKIRSGLPNAMVTTYTYDPLVGVTSVTDPKGYMIYYEYDSFNRLAHVKENGGKILSKNEYHYKK